MKNSMDVTRRSPAWGVVGACGVLKAFEGLRSSSVCRSDTRRCTSAIAATPVSEASARLMCTLVIDATCPHSAAPAAVAPMIAI